MSRDELRATSRPLFSAVSQKFEPRRRNEGFMHFILLQVLVPQVRYPANRVQPENRRLGPSLSDHLVSKYRESSESCNFDLTTSRNPDPTFQLFIQELTLTQTFGKWFLCKRRLSVPTGMFVDT